MAGDAVTVIDIPGIGPVDFPSSMSDAQMTAAAKRLHDEHANVSRSRQTLTAANQQPLPRTPTLGDEFTLSKMGDRALSGLKGEAEGFVGGVAAPVAALGYGIMHPVDAAERVAKGVAGAGVLAAQAVTHPSETWDAAKNLAFTIGNDPEHLGQVAGGVDAALAVPAGMKYLSDTRVGRAVSAGVSDAANKIPGVRAARLVLAPPAAKVVAAPAEPVAGPPTFNDLPLAQQMEHFPDVPAPMRGRLRMATPLREPPAPPSPFDRYAPNISGTPSDLPFGPSASDVPIPRSPIERYAPNISAGHTDLPFGPSASDVPIPRSPIERYAPNISADSHAITAASEAMPRGITQGVYAQLPDGSWGVRALPGHQLAEGEAVNVMSRTGTPKVITVGKVGPDGVAALGGGSPSEDPRVLELIRQRLGGK